MDKRMRLRRLKKLAEILSKIKDKEYFFMHNWVTHHGKGAPHLTEDNQLGCGTAACALGYAAMHPEFTRRGLKLRKYSHGSSPSRWTPTFEGASTFEAGERFFGITPPQACRIFTSQAGNTPRQVAASVRRLIRQYERA